MERYEWENFEFAINGVCETNVLNPMDSFECRKFVKERLVFTFNINNSAKN